MLMLWMCQHYKRSIRPCYVVMGVTTLHMLFVHHFSIDVTTLHMLSFIHHFSMDVATAQALGLFTLWMR